MAMTCENGCRECCGCGECLTLEKRHHCSKCGEPIYEGDDYYDLHGDPYCEECLEQRRRTA